MGKRTPDSIEQRAREIWQGPYSCVVVREADGYSAKVLEFPGCFAEGDTAAEAHANLEETAIAWIQDQLDKGDPIPAPQPEYEHSGRFLLRIPRSLHARAARLAALDNVSLNQFISTALAEKVASTMAITRVHHATIIAQEGVFRLSGFVSHSIQGVLRRPIAWDVSSQQPATSFEETRMIASHG